MIVSDAHLSLFQSILSRHNTTKGVDMIASDAGLLVTLEAFRELEMLSNSVCNINISCSSLAITADLLSVASL
jgi:hypothetical protein